MKNNKCMTCNTETCTFLHCMHCEIEISEEVITNNTTEEWRNKQFAKKNNTIVHLSGYYSFGVFTVN